MIIKLQRLERLVLDSGGGMRTWLVTAGPDGKPPLEHIILDPSGLDQVTAAMRAGAP